MGLWAVSFFFPVCIQYHASGSNENSMIIAIIIFNPSTVLTVLLPILLCMLIFSLFTSFFPPFLYTYDPIWPLYKRKPFPQFYYFFFLLSSQRPSFIKKPCGWSFSFSFSIIFFPSFLTLYKVETLLLQQKKIPCSLRSVFCHLGPTHSTFVIFLCF